MNQKKSYRSITIPISVYNKIVQLKREIDRYYGLDVKLYAVIDKAVQRYLDEIKSKNKNN